MVEYVADVGDCEKQTAESQKKISSGIGGSRGKV